MSKQYDNEALKNLQVALDKVGGDHKKLNDEDGALWNSMLNMFLEQGGSFEVVKNQLK